MTVTTGPALPAIGNNKMYASLFAGAVTVVAVYIIDQFVKTPLPAEVVASVQTIITTAVVYFTNHGGK